MGHGNARNLDPVGYDGTAGQSFNADITINVENPSLDPDEVPPEFGIRSAYSDSKTLKGRKC